MRYICKFFIITVVTFALLFVALVGMLLMLDPMCSNEILSENVSPSKKLKVVVFQRDCGATTGFSTQVSLLAASASLPNDAGNLWIADDNHGSVPSGPGGGPAVTVVWESPTNLVIAHHPAARVFLAAPNIDAVDVRYTQLSSDNEK